MGQGEGCEFPEVYRCAIDDWLYEVTIESTVIAIPAHTRTEITPGVHVMPYAAQVSTIEVLREQCDSTAIKVVDGEAIDVRCAMFPHPGDIHLDGQGSAWRTMSYGAEILE